MKILKRVRAFKQKHYSMSLAQNAGRTVLPIKAKLPQKPHDIGIFRFSFNAYVFNMQLKYVYLLNLTSCGLNEIVYCSKSIICTKYIAFEIKAAIPKYLIEKILDNIHALHQWYCN